MLGTGTGVGKTYVTRALAHALRRVAPHTPLLALKPVETGIDPLRTTGFAKSQPFPATTRGEQPADMSTADADQADADQLAAACHLCEPPDPHPLYAFREPLSPHLVARREHVEISPEAIGAWVGKAEQPHREGICLVETAGGLFSPISNQATNHDVAVALAATFRIIVVPDALGVLHDLRATLMALATADRLSPRDPTQPPTTLIVMTPARGVDGSTGTNAAEIETLGLGPVAACLAWTSDIGANALRLEPLACRLAAP